MFEALKRVFQQNKISRPTQKQSDGKDSACDGHASSPPDQSDVAGKLSSDEKLAFLVEKGIKVLRENWRENIQEKGAYTGTNPPRARRISARSPEEIRHPAGRVRQ